MAVIWICSDPKTFSAISMKRFRKAEMCFLRQQRSQTDAMVIVGWLHIFIPFGILREQEWHYKDIFSDHDDFPRGEKKETLFWGQK